MIVARADIARVYEQLQTQHPEGVTAEQLRGELEGLGHDAPDLFEACQAYIRDAKRRFDEGSRRVHHEARTLGVDTALRFGKGARVDDGVLQRNRTFQLYAERAGLGSVEQTPANIDTVLTRLRGTPQYNAFIDGMLESHGLLDGGRLQYGRFVKEVVAQASNETEQAWSESFGAIALFVERVRSHLSAQQISRCAGDIHDGGYWAEQHLLIEQKEVTGPQDLLLGAGLLDERGLAELLTAQGKAKLAARFADANGLKLTLEDVQPERRVELFHRFAPHKKGADAALAQASEHPSEVVIYNDNAAPWEHLLNEAGRFDGLNEKDLRTLRNTPRAQKAEFLRHKGATRRLDALLNKNATVVAVVTALSEAGDALVVSRAQEPTGLSLELRGESSDQSLLLGMRELSYLTAVLWRYGAAPGEAHKQYQKNWQTGSDYVVGLSQAERDKDAAVILAGLTALGKKIGPGVARAETAVPPERLNDGIPSDADESGLRFNVGDHVYLRVGDADTPRWYASEVCGRTERGILLAPDRIIPGVVVGPTGVHITREQLQAQQDVPARERLVLNQAALAHQHDIAEVNLRRRLTTRGGRATTELQFAEFHSEVLSPLQELFAAPDATRWNEPTWSLFQAYTKAVEHPDVGATVSKLVGDVFESEETPDKAMLLGMLRAAQAVKRAKPDGEDLARRLRDGMGAVESGVVNPDTLHLLVRADLFLRQATQEYANKLSPAEQESYSQICHDLGYYAVQSARFEPHPGADGQITESLLVRPSRDGGLADDMAALLAPDAREMLADRRSDWAAGDEPSLPKLSLLAFFEVDGRGRLLNAEQGREAALEFFRRAGKDVEGPNEDLDGRSIREFLDNTVAGKNPAAELNRHRFFNGFAQSWTALKEQAAAFGGRAAEHQLAFLQEKQVPAWLPAVVLMNVSPLRAGGSDRDGYSSRFGGAADAIWRVANPHFSFDHPQIETGYAAGDLAADRAKTQGAWKAVLDTHRTAYLVGLAEKTYRDNFGATATRYSDADSRDIALGELLGRLERDAGADNPAMLAARAELDLNSPDALQQLHQLRLDPSLFAMRVESENVRVGSIVGHLVGAENGNVTPEEVAATTVGYRVRLATDVGPFRAGQEVLLRLAKGATYSVGSDGGLRARVHHRSRLNDTRVRLADGEAIAEAHGLPWRDRFVVSQAGETLALLEPAGTGRASDDLAANRVRLAKADVERLSDLYVQGLAQQDEASGRRFGVFYELGPDNATFGPQGVEPLYLDAAMFYRSEWDREEYGFFGGTYGSAINWILADPTPKSREDVAAVWRGDSLSSVERERRDLFLHALEARVDVRHPIYKSMSAANATRVRTSLERELQRIRGES